jgi:hypothetical protein
MEAVGGELVPWLRAEVERELAEARAREAACLEGPAFSGRHDVIFEARERIARSEGVLMVLDFHDVAENWERAVGKPQRQAEVLRIVVRQIGHGYRYRDGYQEVAWKP